MMRRQLSGLTLCLIGVASPVFAQDQPSSDKFWIQAGIYYPDVNTSVRVQGPNPTNPATDISFERDLDFDDRVALPSVAAGMRIGTDWRIVGEFYRLERSREASLDRTITFDDVTYPVNASVRARFASDVYRLSVGYSFVNTPKIEIGANIGAHLTDFEVGIEGSGSIGTAAASFQERRRRVFAPLPTVGGFAEWRPAPKVMLSTRVDYLSLKIDDYDGRLLNAQASAAYEITRGLSLGAMWRHVDYRLRVSRSDWTGQVNYRFTGPTLFLEYRF